MAGKLLPLEHVFLHLPYMGGGEKGEVVRWVGGEVGVW